jgi:Rod binding domain-containing protein
MTSLLANPVDAMSLSAQAPLPASAAELAKRGQIHATAQKFEASFITTVFQTMFQDVNTDSAFSGGQGEDMWKGFLAEEMAKSVAKRGGIGISHAVEREMLKMQGLSDAPATPPSTSAASTDSPPANTFAASLPRVGDAPAKKPVLQ